MKTRIKAYGSDQALPVARETMLSVRLESADAWAFPYTYLTSIYFEQKASKITITFNTHRVLILGKHLNLLYEALLGQAVQFLQITAGQDLEENDCDIISLAVEELQPSERPPEQVQAPDSSEPEFP